MNNKTNIVGILNVTPDSFSDGGQFFNKESAVKRGIEMIEQGASIIDVGAESTHPDSRRISAEEELKVLEPVVRELKNQGVTVSVDTYKPEVISKCLEWGVDMINDVTALGFEESLNILSGSQIPIVIMYSRSKDAHAEKVEGTHDHIIGEIKGFFYDKIDECKAAGIHSERLILDPGMGFFLGSNPEPSLKVLKHLAEFRELGCKTYISTSRKSFIGTITGREVQDRSAGTLATELWSAIEGVDYIRTHNVKDLNDSLKMIQAIKQI